jgi:group I intron endonuclease
MNETKKSGIYCIENIVNCKKYIGQSIDIEERWKKHVSELKHGRHYNDYLQNSWYKYGENNFKFYILEYCNIDILDDREIYWINFYNTISRDNGYNLKSGGQNGGSRYSEQSRKKMSLAHKEFFKNEENIEMLRKNALAMWSDKDYHKSRCGENHPLYGKKLSDDTRKKISNSSKGKKKPSRTKEHCKAISESKKGKPSPNKDTTPVRCIELDLMFEDAITAGKKLGIKSPNHVIDVCKKRRKTCGGYHWEFITN